MSSPHKSQHHEEENEEGWLVSYADLMTLLFGLFVILYSLSKVDEKKYEEHSQKIVEAFTGKNVDVRKEYEPGFVSEFRQLRAFKLLVENLALGENVDQAIKKIEELNRVEKDMQAFRESIEKKLTEEQKRQLEFMKSLKADSSDEMRYFEIMIPTVSLFAPGNADLLPTAKQQLLLLGREIKALKDIGEVEVQGHTDSIQPSTSARFANNWALSSARAGSVAQVLMNLGIDPKILKVRGMANLDPLQPENVANALAAQHAREKNRRVHIILKRKIRDEPKSGPS